LQNPEHSFFCNVETGMLLSQTVLKLFEARAFYEHFLTSSPKYWLAGDWELGNPVNFQVLTESQVKRYCYNQGFPYTALAAGLHPEFNPNSVLERTHAHHKLANWKIV
jgi:hypothetical protein